MLISLHIPKTAGTAWRLYLEANAGRGVLFDTVEDRDRNDPARTARAAMEAGRPDEARAAIAASGARMIHGHRAGDFCALYPEATVMTFIREPRERAAAEFVHLRRRPRAENPLFAAVHAGEADFPAFLEGRGPIYSHLFDEVAAGRAPALVFLTEAPERAEAACARALGWRGGLPKRNVAPRDQQAEARALIETHAALLDRVLARDLEIYAEWRSRWESGAAQALAAETLAHGPPRAAGGAIATARRRIGALKERAGRLIGADWR